MGVVITPVGATATGVAGEASAHIGWRVVKVDFDSSLAAGGEAILPQACGMTSILGMVEIGADTITGVLYKFDVDGVLLSAYETGAAADAVFAEADTDDVGVAYFLVIGVLA